MPVTLSLSCHRRIQAIAIEPSVKRDLFAGTFCQVARGGKIAAGKHLGNPYRYVLTLYIILSGKGEDYDHQ